MNIRDQVKHKFGFSNLPTMPYRMSRAMWLFLLAALLLGGSVSQRDSVSAERTNAQSTEPAKVAAAVRGNAQALKSFTWQQRVQLQLKGDVKKVTLNQMNYDMYGNQQKTLISEQPSADAAQPSGGRLKQRIVAKKTDDFKQMMDDIVALVKSYSEMPPDQLQAALKQGSFSSGQGDMQGSVQIQMNGVLQSGDAFTLWIDQNVLLFRRVTIATTYENNPVTVVANFTRLSSGEVYMGQAILTYPAKQVVLQIDNLNYQRNQ